VKQLALITLQIIILASVPGVAFGNSNQSAANSTAAVQTVSQDEGPPAASDRPVLQQRNPRYRVQPDDGLVISFPLSPEFDQPIHCMQTTNCSVVVQPDGYIDLEGAASVRVQGMTVPEVVEAVKRAYSGILHGPIVHVALVDFQKPFFLVLGQVGKPGQYDLRHDLTVTQALALAGGFSAGAKTQVLLYHPISASTMEVKRLNVKDILNGKNVNEEVHVSPGDMIFVPEKAITKFRKYVPYGVGTGVYPSVPAL
jgi:polysaccharide biosynthesis/export protein